MSYVILIHATTRGIEARKFWIIYSYRAWQWVEIVSCAADQGVTLCCRYDVMTRAGTRHHGAFKHGGKEQ